jgi:hypothetical protein
MPTELSSDDIAVDDLANQAGGGMIWDDGDAVYFVEVRTTNALVRMDPVTGAKIQLAEPTDKRWHDMFIAGASDDRIYFLTEDTDPVPGPTKSFQQPSMSLYSVRKDGTDLVKALPMTALCLVDRGVAYYVPEPSGMDLPKDLYRCDLATGVSEKLIEGRISELVIDGSGRRLFYLKRSSSGMYEVYEFELNARAERLVLKQASEGEKTIQSARCLRYYDEALYFVEKDVVRKYDLEADAITTAVENPGPVGSATIIVTFAISRMGFYMIAGSSASVWLYKADTPIPVGIVQVPQADANALQGSIGFARGSVIVVFGYRFHNGAYITAYDETGRETGFLF